MSSAFQSTVQSCYIGVEEPMIRMETFGSVVLLSGGSMNRIPTWNWRRGVDGRNPCRMTLWKCVDDSTMGQSGPLSAQCRITAQKRLTPSICAHTSRRIAGRAQCRSDCGYTFKQQQEDCLASCSHFTSTSSRQPWAKVATTKRMSDNAWSPVPVLMVWLFTGTRGVQWDSRDDTGLREIVTYRCCTFSELINDYQRMLTASLNCGCHLDSTNAKRTLI